MESNEILSEKQQNDAKNFDSQNPDVNTEKNDCSTFGQSLIKFMSSATGSVKTALQKPANYKKNINHRRYLQKQLKICTRKKKRSTKSKTSSNSKKTFAKNSVIVPSTAELWLNQENDLPVCARQEVSQQILPFQEEAFLPYDTSFQTAGVLSAIECSFEDLSFFANKQGSFYNTQESVNPIVQEGFSLVPLVDNAGHSYRDDILPDVLEETGHFMTGEELTRNLDIKDLFVPEGFEHFGGHGQEIDTFAHSTSLDGNVYSSFQTFPSTTNILNL